MIHRRLTGVTVASILAIGFPAVAATQVLHLPIQHYTLDNGLKVVLVPNSKTGTVNVKTFYGIGFRVEPRERTGFAHLFEHLMFQGSQNAPKGRLIGDATAAGGFVNGSTRFDYTDYVEWVPSNALERMLWLDGDRMARPVIEETVLKNQQGVVGNEVKVNVLNAPYGAWPWIDLPMLANSNWYNAHNFYGDLKEIEAATVADAKDFSARYYKPNNASLVIQGDFNPVEARAMVQRYFGAIPAGPKVVLPDLREAPQTKARVGSRVDPLAPKPGYSFAYHVPARGSSDWYAMGLIDQMLLQGDDSRLRRALSIDRSITGDLDGGVNAYLGDMYTYHGPALWMVNFTHDSAVSAASIKAIVDSVITDFLASPPSAKELARAKVKAKAALYRSIADESSAGLADLVGLAALFGDDPTFVNRIPDAFDSVTAAQVQKTAREYLRPEQRSTFTIVPGKPAGESK
ncbi:MAG TPA: pitrilysin family protein [Gemmatimonadaceae bacterium]|nr:pitrilysin family protein [Gemmatimonadaceae bacterium]